MYKHIDEDNNSDSMTIYISLKKDLANCSPQMPHFAPPNMQDLCSVHLVPNYSQLAKFEISSATFLATKCHISRNKVPHFSQLYITLFLSLFLSLKRKSKQKRKVNKYMLKSHLRVFFLTSRKCFDILSSKHLSKGVNLWLHRKNMLLCENEKVVLSAPRAIFFAPLDTV